ncbi:MAG: histidinol dehydrogenase [Dehalococcoidia bacterium]|nr:histidinol dehydrogenase [Dehalococcoidia bacterium]
MRIVKNLSEARATVLRRKTPGEAVMPPAQMERLREVFGEPLTPDQAVDRILDEVRRRGDSAVREYSLPFDGQQVDELEVPRSEIEAAPGRIPAELLDALTLAAGRIRDFHQRQVPQDWFDTRQGMVGQIFRPLDRVGIYVPGGTAAYPSTVLMTAIPARVAGVGEVVVTTPPRYAGPAVLAAAALAGVDRLFRVGGAQAIAAMAYGTETIPKVDKIMGPGGLFVLLAKRKVYGQVDVDCLAGPTETMILADDSASPACCAADLLAQAEHDPLASAILITTSVRQAEAVSVEVERQLSSLARRETAELSLENNGGIVIVDSLIQGLELANEYAPEHLCLMVEDPWALVGRVRNAGAIFLGEESHETLGDYVAGPSHVMPTGGSARFASPLVVRDFIKEISVIALGTEAARSLEGAARTIALAEGLEGHARAVEARWSQRKGDPK